MKRQAWNWEKIFVTHIGNKWLWSSLYQLSTNLKSNLKPKKPHLKQPKALSILKTMIWYPQYLHCTTLSLAHWVPTKLPLSSFITTGPFLFWAFATAFLSFLILFSQISARCSHSHPSGLSSKLISQSGCLCWSLWMNDCLPLTVRPSQLEKALMVLPVHHWTGW